MRIEEKALHCGKKFHRVHSSESSPKKAFQVFVCCFAWFHLFLMRTYFDMSTRTLFEEHVLQLSDARMQTRNHAKWKKKQNASWKSWRNSFKFIGIWALNEFSAWKTCNYKDEQRQTSWETKVYAESTAPSLNCEYVYMCIRLSSDTNHREKETEMWKMCVEKVDAKVEMGIVCTRF